MYTHRAPSYLPLLLALGNTVASELLACNLACGRGGITLPDGGEVERFPAGPEDEGLAGCCTLRKCGTGGRRCVRDIKMGELITNGRSIMHLSEIQIYVFLFYLQYKLLM